MPVPHTAPMSWFAIVRLGVVQAALGSVVVLVISTLNRVMVVEYALPAMLPGLLIALHYIVQAVRPRFGYGSDRGGRRTPWIIGGMAVLSAGGMLCSFATTSMSVSMRGPMHGVFGAAIAMALAGYALVGLGVGAAGTTLLALLASQVDARRRAAAATIMWILMIAGFAVTSTIVGHFLDPFSRERLLRVSGATVAAAFALALFAVWGVERPRQSLRASDAFADGDGRAPGANATRVSFARALRTVWSEPRARTFTLFVFVSMLAYSAQELLLEPFSGLMFGYSLGESAKLSGSWHAAILLGMISVGIFCSGRRRHGSLRRWTSAGCFASALALASLTVAGFIGPAWPLRLSVTALGLANGVFTLSAIGSMMELANEGAAQMAGVRMGLWGAAQALAFALGGLVSTALVDGLRWWLGSAAAAFGVVFALQALLFLAAARLAAQVDSSTFPQRHPEAVIA